MLFLPTMSFLFPQFLFGLAALTIPVVIHLFNFRKTKRIYYSGTQFLKQVKEASTSKLKLKHWLILASRLLFILFLVIAFAQPFIPAKQKGLKSSEVYIYLDNSYSMSGLVSTDYRALDAGISIVNELSDLFPAGTRFKLFTNDFASYSNVYKSGFELSDLTTEIHVSGNIRGFEEVLSRIKTGMLASATPGEIFWISDFQKSTFGPYDPENPDTLYHINIVPLELEHSANLFVDSIFLKNPFTPGNEKIELTVVIKNTGNEDVIDVPIKIFLNDIQTSNAILDIPASARVEQHFDLGFDLQDISKGRISLEDYPVTFDNDFYFTINIGDVINILEIKSSTTATAIEKVYANTKLFNFKTFRFTNVDYSQIAVVDLVILNELEILDPSIRVLLTNYLNTGGTIVLIPPVNPDMDSYSQFITGRSIIFPDSLYQESLAPPDLTNPFYENVFEEVHGIIAMPESTQVLEWGADRNALLSFRNGKPFLSGIITAGNLFVFASPLNDVYSEFQNHAVFVPVMYKIAFGGKKEQARLYYSVNQPIIRIAVDSLAQNTIIKLVEVERELIPAQRISSGSVLLELPSEIIGPGFYDVMAGSKKLGTVAFNLDRRESLPEQYSQDDIQQLFAGKNKITIFNAGDQKDFANTVTKLYKGTPLWKYAIIFALIFLLVEVAFIRLLKP